VEIIIIGAGGHGSEVYSYIQDMAALDPCLRVAGFVDEHKARGPWLGTEILGNFEELRASLRLHESCRYITAAGNNQVRRAFVKKAESSGALSPPAWSLIHPRAAIGRDVEIGVGACLAPGSIVTTRVRIGRHCIVNVNASVSHDCVVGDFVNINPGAVVAGNAKIGEGCFIGAAVTVIEKVTIGEWTVIGAGAVVVDDIPAHVTAVGVPARVIKQHNA
jgi:sugar O-acyltransferase (sialic acid O-acetyltransferase NeuD family)